MLGLIGSASDSGAAESLSLAFRQLQPAPQVHITEVAAPALGAPTQGDGYSRWHLRGESAGATESVADALTLLDNLNASVLSLETLLKDDGKLLSRLDVGFPGSTDFGVVAAELKRRYRNGGGQLVEFSPIPPVGVDVMSWRRSASQFCFLGWLSIGRCSSSPRPHSLPCRGPQQAGCDDTRVLNQCHSGCRNGSNWRAHHVWRLCRHGIRLGTVNWPIKVHFGLAQGRRYFDGPSIAAPESVHVLPRPRATRCI